MPHASFFYFTGTGNTRRAVERIRIGLESSGWTADIEAIRPDTALSAACKADLFVFATAVYSFAVPAIVKRFIRRIARRTDAPRAALFLVHGGGPYQAGEQARRRLERRGFRVVWSGSGAAYPENWTQFSNPPSEEDCVSMRKHGDDSCDEFVRDVLVGVERLEKSAAGFLTWLIAAGFGVWGRRLLGKGFIADAYCTSCGICARDCPQGTIRMRGPRRARRPSWKFDCENCHRCINLCPAKAIQNSPARLVVHLVAQIAGTAGIVIGARGLGTLLSGSWGAAAATATALGAGVAALLLLVFLGPWLLDLVLFPLQRLPGLRRLFEASWTRTFRRYRSPGFDPKEES